MIALSQAEEIASADNEGAFGSDGFEDGGCAGLEIESRRVDGDDIDIRFVRGDLWISFSTVGARTCDAHSRYSLMLGSLSTNGSVSREKPSASSSPA